MLTDNDKPPDIIAAAVPLTALHGKTPGQTLYSVRYAENKRPDTRLGLRSTRFPPRGGR